MFESVWEYIEELEIFVEEVLVEYGLEVFFSTQLLSGMGLLVFMPDGLVTPTFLLSYAESFFDLAVVALVSASALTLGNYLLFLFFRFLGHRFVSEERKTGRLWRLMSWMLERHPKFSLFFFRLMPVGSGLIAIPAGLINVKSKTFLIYSFLGFLTFELALSTLAWHGFEQGAIWSYVTDLELGFP